MTRPNILFLMCDQLQGRVFEPHSPCLTPNLDRLAAKGARFRRAYTPNAVCSPARASLMTGLLPHNHGVLWVTHNCDPDQSVLREDKPHWAQHLVDAGYRTGYFGKWHVERSEDWSRYGWQVNGDKSTPWFNDAAKRLRKESRSDSQLVKCLHYQEPEGYDSSKLFYGVTDQAPEQRPMGISTSIALEFLDKMLKQTDPWCCFVSLKEPHDPYTCGQQAYAMYDVEQLQLAPNAYDNLDGRPNIYKKVRRVWDKYTDRDKKEALACYYASITEIDQQFGRLIERLKQSDQYDNTIVVLTSDHGDLMGAHGLYCKNMTAAEEVYNIPLIMAGPGIVPGIVSEARVGLHDLCPTLLELTQSQPIDVPDSRSFAAVLSQPELAKNYSTGYAEYHGGRMLLTQRVVWDGDWKFVFNGFDFDELYHLESDPYEMHNRIDDSDQQQRIRAMTARLWQVIRATNDHSLYNTHYPILRTAPYGPNIVDEAETNCR